MAGVRYRVLYDIGAEHYHWAVPAVWLMVATIWILGWPLSALFPRVDRGQAFSGAMFGVVVWIAAGAYFGHQFLHFQAFGRECGGDDRRYRHHLSRRRIRKSPVRLFQRWRSQVRT